MSSDSGNLLLLSGPAFFDFCNHLAFEYKLKNPMASVFSLYTGSLDRQVDYLNDPSCSPYESWIDLSALEETLLSQPKNSASIKALDSDYTPGLLGRILISDRRIGSSFVSGGRCRPSLIGDKVKNHNLHEHYIDRLVRYFEKYLEESRISTVFCYATASAVAIALYEVCRKQEIAFRTIVHTRYQDFMIIDDSPYGNWTMYDIAKGNNDTISASALKAFYDFKLAPSHPQYYKTFSSINILKGFVLSVCKALYLLLQSLFSLNSTKFLLRAKICLFDSFSALSALFSFYKFPSCKNLPESYIFYTLHVEPEASTMVLSPYLNNQIYIIETIAKSLPSGVSLVVKEHNPMFGKRPSGFYKKIVSFPKTYISDPSIPSLDLIKSAISVIGITSTSVLEAAFLDKPSFCLSNLPFTKFFPSITFVDNLKSLPECLAQTNIDKPPIDNSAPFVNYFKYITCNGIRVNANIFFRSSAFLSLNESRKRSITSYLLNAFPSTLK